METVRDTTDLPETNVRSLLAKLLFSGNKVFQKAATLSGGEKTRLSIALLLLQDFNLLILDEPTTYLDSMSQRIILEALKDYHGAMLIVSHTEEFVSELQPRRGLLLPEERVVYWSPVLLNAVNEV
jgi:ATPase subunit of ABC transporter with duplicated ATPase domains